MSHIASTNQSSLESYSTTRNQIIEIACAFQEASILQQAVELNVFEHLKDKALSTQELASQLQWRVQSLRTALEALWSMELLIFNQVHDVWSLAECARTYLLKDSPLSVNAMILHERKQQDLWTNISHVLSKSHPIPGQQSLTLTDDPERGQLLIQAMTQIDPSLLSQLSQYSFWKDRNYVLDIGGGHGRGLAYLIQNHPQLSGSVLDLEVAAPLAQKTFKDLEITDRCGFIAQNVTYTYPFENIPNDTDTLLLCRVCHQWGANTLTHIFEEAYKKLPKQGILVIVGRHLDQDMQPSENAAFGAYMALNFHDGWQPPNTWLKSTLEQTGFTVQSHQISTYHSIWLAHKDPSLSQIDTPFEIQDSINHLKETINHKHLTNHHSHNHVSLTTLPREPDLSIHIDHQAVTGRDLIDIAGSFTESTLLLQSVQWNLYDYTLIAKSISEISLHLGIPSHRLYPILAFLASCDLLEHNQNKWTTSSLAKRHLTSQSPDDLRAYLSHLQSMYQPWQNLDYLFDKNRSSHDFYQALGGKGDLINQQSHFHFTQAMHQESRLLTLEFPKVLSLFFSEDDSFRIVDLGGGHGAHLKTILDHFPNAEGLLIDSAPAIQYASSWLSDQNQLKMNVLDLAQATSWDSIKGEVFMFNNVLSNLGRVTSKQWIQKALNQLSTNDLLIISGPKHTIKHPWAGCFALHMAVGCYHGWALYDEWIKEVLSQANCESMRLDLLDDTWLWIGKKQ